MRRYVVALSSLLSVLVSSSAVAQQQSVSNGRLVGEVAAGTIAVPLGFVAGYTIGSGLRPHGSSNTGVIGGIAGALVGPATAVNWVGNGGPSHGNFGATIGGTALGFGAAYTLLPLVKRVPTTPLKIAAFVATATLPAVGATLAYNSTRK